MTMADPNADKAAAPPSHVGVLLVNLGTPDTADAKGVRVYLEGVPVRSAGDREPGPGLAADPQWLHPAHPPAHQGARLSEDLEYRAQRVAAEDHHARAGREARARHRRSRSCRGRLGDALWQSVDPRRDRVADEARLRPAAGRAALSAIFGGDLGDRLRRGVSRAGVDARAADLAGEPALLRRSELHRGARRSRSRRISPRCRSSRS